MKFSTCCLHLHTCYGQVSSGWWILFLFSNDKVNFLGIKSTLIYPATEKHIAKYSQQEVFLMRETAEDYRAITLPYIESSQFSTQVRKLCSFGLSLIKYQHFSGCNTIHVFVFSGLRTFWRRKRNQKESCLKILTRKQVRFVTMRSCMRMWFRSCSCQ